MAVRGRLFYYLNSSLWLPSRTNSITSLFLSYHISRKSPLMWHSRQPLYFPLNGCGRYVVKHIVYIVVDLVRVTARHGFPNGSLCRFVRFIKDVVEQRTLHVVVEGSVFSDCVALQFLQQIGSKSE